jgi:hypothetical protein
VGLANRARSSLWKLACSTLCVISGGGDVEALFGDPFPIWKAWADDVRVVSIDSGHTSPRRAQTLWWKY